MPADVHLGVVRSQPFDENTYVVGLAGRNDCVIVDPGFEPAKIVQLCDQQRLTPVAILCTHGHSDHIAGNAAMQERWPGLPIVIGHGDASKLIDPYGNLSGQFGLPMVSPPADRTVKHGQRLELAGIALEVRETPGHSSGHVVFLLADTDPLQVLGGDVLFRLGVGRTDFPDGSPGDLVRSIHEQLFSLPDSTVVLPGHGPATTVGFEKQHNPYVGAAANWEE